jgi:hypothetical protein
MQADTVRLTYAEAAARLGCLEKSVATRAKRRGWKREKGNDGLMRVHIPRDSIPDSKGDSIPDSGPTVREVELIGQINALEAKLEAERATVHRLEQDKAEAAQREAWMREQIEQLQNKQRSWWPW